MNTHCLSCGAPVDLHAEKCAYCGTPYPRDMKTQKAEAITLDLNPVQLAEAAVEALERGLITPNKARRALGLEEV